MSTKKLSVTVVPLQQEQAPLSHQDMTPQERIRLALKLTSAAWAIRRARGERIPDRMEKVVKVRDLKDNRG